VEGVLGFAAVSRRIRQRTHHLEEFYDGSRPPMRQDDRQRIRVFRPHVQEMNTEAVNLGPVLRNRVQPSFKAAHVVAGPPIVRERLHLRHGHAFGPVVERLFLRPAGCGKPGAQIVESSSWNSQAEFRHRLRGGRHRDLRGFRRCFVRGGQRCPQPECA
jgi:hypothetical protein